MQEAGFLPKTGASSWVPRLVPRVPDSPPKAAHRRRLKHHSETPSAEVLSVVALPIWLGSSIRKEVVLLKDIKSIVPEDLHQHDDVIAIEEAESDASFCATHQRFVDAAEHLEQAICVRQQLLGDEHEELLASIEKYVVSCNSWGVHCLGTGNFTAALELFKKAEAMTEADNVPNFKSRVALRAVTFNNLCCYYRTRGKLNAALQFAEKALKIEQRYKEADSPARSFLNYGVLLSNSGRHNEALEHVERAVAVLHDQERHQEAEVGGGSEPSETAQLLVVAHYNMFVENLHLKHFATCLQCLQRAVNVAQSKLGSSHNLTIKMQGVQAEAQARLERKASAECFRTTAAVVESSPVFFHYQDGHCHPWQKVNIAQTDATRAQEILADQKQITLRRLRPVDPRPPEKPRIRSRRPKPQIYARLPAIGNEVTSRWWASHPKLLDTEGYAGSPILTQQAHGAQPMVELLALRQCAGRGQDGGHGMDSEALQTDLDAVSDAKASTQPLPLGRQQVIPVPPGAPPEVVASWEYHHRRLQMLEDGGGLTALEPQRMRAITVLRDRLDKRREKGLPTPTDYKKHQAATCIQAGIRGYLVRQWTSEELAREMRRQRALEASAFESSPTSDAKKRAAYRVIYAARRAFVEYNAAVKIQKVARGTMTRAKLKRQISRIAHSSAAKVQALVRGRSVRSSLRRKSEAATQIQAFARMRSAKRETESIRRMSRLANKLARGFLVRRQLHKQQKAAIQLQRLVRGVQTRQWFARRKAAVLQIQRVARGSACRRRLFQRSQSSTLISAYWRGHLSRTHQSRMTRAATTIQSAYRSSLERRWFLKLRKVVKKLRLMSGGSSGAGFFEDMSRMMQIHSKTMTFFQRRKLLGNTLEAVRIQRFMRGYQTRERLRRAVESCIRIQAYQRSLSTRRRMVAKILAAVRLQSFTRARQAVRRREQQTTAAMRIQSVHRGRSERLRLKAVTAGIVKLQALWRGVWCRTKKAGRAQRERSETDGTEIADLSRDSLDWDPVLAPIQATLQGVLACARSPTQTPSDLECMEDDSRAASVDFDPTLGDGRGHFDSTQLEEASESDGQLVGIIVSEACVLDETCSHLDGLNSSCGEAGWANLREGPSDDLPQASSLEEDSASLQQRDVAAMLGDDLVSSLDDPHFTSSLLEASQDPKDISAKDVSSLLEGPSDDLPQASSLEEDSASLQQRDVAAMLGDDLASSLDDPHFTSSLLEASQDLRDGSTRLEDPVGQDPESSQDGAHFASSLLEDSLSQEDCPRIIIDRDALRDQGEPNELPIECQDEGAALVALLVGDALDNSMASRLMTPQPEDELSENFGEASPTASAFNASRDTAWTTEGFVANVIDDVVEMHGVAPTQDGRSFPDSTEDDIDPLLVQHLTQALAQEDSLQTFQVAVNAGEVSPPVDRKVEAEGAAVVTGMLEGGLSSRWSSPVDFEGSDASEESSRNVIESMVGCQLEDIVRACDVEHQGAALDSGIDEDVAGPSIEDLDKANSSIAEIHQEVENMVPADPSE